MPKLVDSMLKVFKREKGSKSKRCRKSQMDADSFVFLPGDNGGQFWGEVLNDENFPIPLSQLQLEDSRRKTHIGLVQSDAEGVQDVNIVFSTRIPEKVLNRGDVFNRRLSGSLVKAKKSTDEVEDGPPIRDYAFLLSNKERISGDLSGRCMYDRLIRSPLLQSSSNPPVPDRAPTQWNYPNCEKRKSSPLANHQQRLKQEKTLSGQYGPRTSTPSNDTLIADQGYYTCSVRDEKSRRSRQKTGPRQSHGYSDLDPSSRSTTGSEYAVPPDAITWGIHSKDLDQHGVVSMREYRSIPPHDLMLGERIGEGQFGDVHSGYLYPKTMDETEVAIKTCKSDASAEDKAKFLEEAAVMCKFKHPNIIKLFGVVSHMDLAYIVMELAPCGQLRRYLLLEGSRITRLMLLDYIAQLASAMVHLEDMNYVHRDIAARNILVCNPQTVKLADFGLSRGLEDGDYYVASRGKLPIKWMAPESINFRRFTGLSDVWMFGVCSWEILMRGVKPFVGIKNDAVISKIEMGERLSLPVECPAPLYALMHLCWKYDPLERPRFVEIEAGIRDIIEEEIKLEEISYRRSYHRSPIEPDPLAPPKAPRYGGGVGSSPVARVSSNSSGTSRVSHNDPSQVIHSVDDIEKSDHTPPLPPRVMERFRDLSTSPPSLGDGGGGNSPTPPFRKIQERESRGPNQHLPPPPHHIPPYSITTISAPEDPEARVQRSESPLGDFRASNTTAHIPPPAILSQHPNHDHGDSRDPNIYYSTPSEVEKRQHRMLNKDGVFVSQDVISPPLDNGGDQGIKPKLWEDRPISRVSTEEDSSGRSSPAHYEEKNRYPSNQAPADNSFVVPDEDDDILKHTTQVVKAIKELSDKVHKSKPNDYIELVKNVGLALRDLLGKVDESLSEIPQEIHNEVLMAQKVLSSDMNHLVSAMKDAQTHYDRFLEQEYQKKMLKAAHVVAVNSKLLLDAVNSAKRKAHLMR